MVEKCEEEISAGVPEPVPGRPAVVVVDESAMKEQVLAEVPAVSGLPTGPQVASALARVVAEVDADLGFRLFLRVLKAYAVPVDLERYDRYREIGDGFGFPAPLVHHGLAVRWPRFDDASVRRRFGRDFGFSFIAGRFHGDLWQHSYTVEGESAAPSPTRWVTYRVRPRSLCSRTPRDCSAPRCPMTSSPCSGR